MKGQLSLNLSRGSHGGRRPGSGRKRIHSKGVAHRTREVTKARFPVHINFKYKIQVRNKDALRILKRAILNSRSHGFRIVHYSLQSNHVHIIAEANNNHILTKGMRSLTVTFAKGMKKGRIQIQRYHLHVLRNLKEAHNAVKYVLLNQQKHSNSKKLNVDQYSSIKFLGINLVRNLIKKEKLTLIWKEDKEKSFLDDPIAWILKNSIPYPTS